MNSQHKSDSLKRLGAICDNQSSLSTRLALLSFNKDGSSIFIEALLLFIEYTQLISQIFLFDLSLSANNGQQTTGFFEGIIYIAKMVNPGFWLPYEGQGSLTMIVLLGIAGITLIKYLLFLYILFIAYRNSQGNNFLKATWRWVFKLQSRVIYSSIAIFWVNAITNISSNEIGFDNFNMGESGVIIWSAFMLATEYLFSLFLELRFCYIIPTKNFLTAKDNKTKILTLTHKITIQLLRIILQTNSTPSAWIFTTFNVVFSAVKSYKFLTTLPYYKLPALYYQSIFFALVSGMNISSFLQVIAKSAGYDGDAVSFIVVNWVIFSIMLMKLYHDLLSKTILDLVTKKKAYASAELLIHKVSIVNYLRSIRKVPSEANKKLDLFHLVNTNINMNIEKILNFNSSFTEQIPIDINNKISKNKLLLHYLETLLNRYPKNNVIKLYLAYFYAKKMKLYGNAIKLIVELRHLNFSNIVMNSSILVFEIQSIMKSEYKQNDDQLDLFTYTMSQSQFAQLKEKVILQTQKQIEICTEILKDAPDLGKLFDWSQKLDILRYQVERKFDTLLKNVPDYFLEPVSIASEYYLRLNHSVSEYQAFKKLYVKRLQKYDKHFESDRLIKENFYQKSNAFVMLSGQKADVGKIIFCTPSVEKMFGGESGLYIGTQISSIMPPSLQGYYSNLFKNIEEKGGGEFFDRINRIYIYHKDGYLIEAETYMNIHPYLTQGFFLNMVFRAIPTKQDFILLRENGDIECATKKVAVKLGLVGNRNFSSANNVNIKMLNEELEGVNQAFNLEALPDKYNWLIRNDDKKKSHFDGRSLKQNLTNLLEVKTYQTYPTDVTSTVEVPVKEDGFKSKAQVVYSTYTTGKDITLKSVEKKEKTEGGENIRKIYHYSCRMENKFYGTTLMKVMILEESSHKHDGKRDVESVKSEQQLHSQMQSNLDVKSFLEPQEEEESSVMTKLEESCNAEAGDEKQSGWINLHNLGSPTIKINSPTGMRLLGSPTNHETLTSPTNPFFTTNYPIVNSLKASRFYQGNSINDHTANFPMAESNNETNVSHTIIPTNSNLPPFLSQKTTTTKAKTRTLPKRKSTKTDQDEEVEFAKIAKLNIPEGSVATSQKSKSSQMRKVSNALKLALTTKYYPRIFYLACFLLYVCLIAVFATQINLKVTLDRTIESLTVKKDILSNAQLRNYNLLFSQSLVRMLYNLYTGSLVPSDLGMIGDYIPMFAGLLQEALDELSTASQDIFTRSNNLDTFDRDLLFQKDVRMYDTYFDVPEQEQVFLNFTSFQATSLIVETGLTVANAYPNFGKVKNQINYFFRNSLNDLLLKNEDISEVFYHSLDNQRKNIEEIADGYMIAESVILAVVTIVFIVMIWKQYYREKTNMYSFIKLNTRGIQEVMKSFTHFKNILEREKVFNEDTERSKSHLGSQKSNVKNHAKGLTKKEALKMPKHSGLRRKYYAYTIALIIFMLTVICLVIMNSMTDKNSMDFFQSKQNQLYFIERMKSRIYGDRSGSQEMLATNDTAEVMGLKSSQALQAQIDDLSSMRVRAMTIFMDEDTSYDPRIQQILFSDGCTLLGADGATFCMILRLEGARNNLINLLDVLEQNLVTISQTYATSDKSAASIKILQTDDYLLQTAAGITLQAQCEYISAVLNESFKESLTSAAEERDTILIVFSVCLIILCFLLWIYILKNLREADNNFKKVLKTFPANIVLSSFILKSFLIKTSKGALDFVKNDI